LLIVNVFGQKESISFKKLDTLSMQGKLQKQNNPYNILAPSQAAFYSAVLPGLGQIYNKQYWKVPVVYGAMGAGVYFYVSNNNEYLNYRQAYFDRVNGRPDTYPLYSKDVLITALNYYKKQRDTSLLITVLVYFLNIIDANVSAHLKQWNVDDNLSFSPVQFQTPSRTALGLQMRINILN